ncbi:hypothetical protein [Cellulomonas septica]|uniref:Uncharacterized protein n=1 Tax=Cellulomonas septica TaxID=285080 RepID=A0ABX1JUS0_9CELL|nr:hypothetical protein [Cellulomonas septica]NKY38050.1 hypothetical protein [Cellulomonas septica]
MGFELDVILHSEPTAWWVPWAPFFGSVVLAVATFLGVVHSSNKNARTIAETETRRHENVVAEAHTVATRNEKVQVLLRLIDESNKLILVTTDLFQTIRRVRSGDERADFVAAQSAFNAQSAEVTSADASAYLYAPESLATLSQRLQKHVGAAFAGAFELDDTELEVRQMQTHAELKQDLSALVNAVQAELGLRPPDRLDDK